MTVRSRSTCACLTRSLGALDRGLFPLEVGVRLLHRDPCRVELGLGDQALRSELLRACQLPGHIVEHRLHLRRLCLGLRQQSARRFELRDVDRWIESGDDLTALHDRVEVDRQLGNRARYLHADLDHAHRLERAGGEYLRLIAPLVAGAVTTLKRGRGR